MGSHVTHRSVLAALIASCTLAACGLLGSVPGSDALDVRYEGNREFDASKLDSALGRLFQDFAAARFKKSVVDDAAYELERAYLNDGYPSVQVTYTYTEPVGAKPIALFTIKEGPHARIEHVTFTGNHAFEARELQAFFLPPAPGLFEETASNYVESNVKSSIEEVSVAYAARGYRDAVVALTGVEFDPTGTRAFLNVDIREGPLFRVARVDVTGGDARVTEDLLNPVRSAFVGRPYYERLSVEIQGRIEELYAKLGFGDVTVTRTKRVSSSDGAVDLGYSVSAGPRITVGAIEVRGNEATRSQFIRSRLALQPGQLYSREAERKSFGRLSRSGVFERVSVRVITPEGEDASSGSVVRPVQVEVLESPPIELFVEPGWGSYERLRFSAGARHKNLFGTGRILDFRGVVSQLAQRGELSLIDPWLFESGAVANISLFGNRRQEPSFLHVESGLGAGLTRRFTPRVEGGVAYHYRRSDAQDVQVLDAEALATLEQVNISEVAANVSYDTRDNVVQPTHGSLSRLGFEYGSPALGSELHFARIRAQSANFLPLGPGTVFGAAFEGGWMRPIGTSTSIPLQERFFNGGENTVRSFREGDLGPKDDSGEPLGGDAFTVFSFELRRRLRGRFEGALFWDIGNVTPDYADFLKFAGLEQGIGLGVRYALPVGPIRLDMAVNPDPGEFASRYVLHFSLGMAF